MKRRMGVAFAVVCWVATGWGAEAPKVEQPWTLDASSWERGKDLLPEPVLRRVKSGEYWFRVVPADAARFQDRKSTRLNSSHPSISYAVFCLKKKNHIRQGRAHPTPRPLHEYRHPLL